MRGYKESGVTHKTVICSICNKHFRSTNAKLVDKLLDLHMKKNHPDEELKIIEGCVSITNKHNTNTTQFSNTMGDKFNQGREILDMLKK